tara:strand:+ start:36 stop:512 length:477 start_codon:yes stop_codon:yes gene_type:complete
MVDRVKQLEEIQNEAKLLFKNKNKDYGDAFANYGTVGVLVRIGDKLSRAQSITNNGINLVDSESLKDTLLDLHNYAAMALMLLDETYDELVLESNTETPNKFNNTVAWTIKGDSGNIYTRKTITYYETNKVIEICSCPSYYFCKSKPQTCKHITSGLF